jgi:hypothetical protein
VLKFSRNSAIPDEASTVVIDVGVNDSYTLTQKTADSIVSAFGLSGPFQLYWTIGAKVSTAQVNEQKRIMTAIGGVQNINAQWTFDSPANLFAATRGEALEPVETGGAIVSVDGPSATDKAIRIPQGSYLRCKHGLAATAGSSRVNKYSVIFDVRIPAIGPSYSFLNMRDGYGVPTQETDFSVDANGALGTTLGFTVFRMTPGVWERVMLTVDLTSNLVRYYVNGISMILPTGNISANNQLNNERLSLSTDGCLLFAGSGATIDVANVQFLSDIPTAWEITRLGGVGIRQYDDKSKWKIADFSESNAANPPAFAIDGNTTNFYHSLWPNEVPQEYHLTIDLIEAKKISAVTFHGRLHNSNHPAIYNTIAFYVSNDLVNWTYLGGNPRLTDANNEIGEVYCDPSAPSGRYLKMSQTDQLALLIGEVYVFGPK